MPANVVLLGAGASAIGGVVPLTSRLLEGTATYDGSDARFRRDNRVLAAWEERRSHPGAFVERWFSELQSLDLKMYYDLQALVSHRIALSMSKRLYPRLHNGSVGVYRTTQSVDQERLWAALSRLPTLSVLTTNYDVIPERGLRARPTAKRPGFNYGLPGEKLYGTIWPQNASLELSGRVPIYKLHGSISWECRNGKLMRWTDCRPAIRGGAFIVPPVLEKAVPPGGLDQVWNDAAQALRSAQTLIVVGYSAPEYDLAMRSFLSENVHQTCAVHIFDPDPSIRKRYESLLPRRAIEAYDGIPTAMHELAELVKNLADRGQ